MNIKEILTMEFCPMRATGSVYKTKILLLAVSILLTIHAHADETQCKSVLHDCDNAVNELQKENALQKQIIADEDERFKTQSKELNTEQIWRPIALGGLVAIGVETLVLVLRK